MRCLRCGTTYTDESASGEGSSLAPSATPSALICAGCEARLLRSRRARDRAFAEQLVEEAPATRWELRQGMVELGRFDAIDLWLGLADGCIPPDAVVRRMGQRSAHRPDRSGGAQRPPIAASPSRRDWVGVSEWAEAQALREQRGSQGSLQPFQAASVQAKSVQAKSVEVEVEVASSVVAGAPARGLDGAWPQASAEARGPGSSQSEPLDLHSNELEDPSGSGTDTHSGSPESVADRQALSSPPVPRPEHALASADAESGDADGEVTVAESARSDRPEAEQETPEPDTVVTVSPFAARAGPSAQRVSHEASSPSTPPSSSGPQFGPLITLRRFGRTSTADLSIAVRTVEDAGDAGGLQRKFVVKRLRAELRDDPREDQRFADEARIHLAIHHANVVSAYEMTRDEHGDALLLEYVDGLDLGTLLRRQKAAGMQMPVGVVCWIIERVLMGLHHVHELRDVATGQRWGIVHRNVCPMNVLVSWAGEVQICNFSRATATVRTEHTQPGVVRGRLHYMSPEATFGRHVDRRSDLFSTAVVAFELLTGQRLFEAETDTALLQAVRAARVPSLTKLNSAVSEAVEHIVMRGLASDAGERPATAQEYCEAFIALRYSEGLRVSAGDLARYLLRLRRTRPVSEVNAVRPVAERSEMRTAGVAGRAPQAGAEPLSTKLAPALEVERADSAPIAEGESLRGRPEDSVSQRISMPRIQRRSSAESANMIWREVSLAQRTGALVSGIVVSGDARGFSVLIRGQSEAWLPADEAGLQNASSRTEIAGIVGRKLRLRVLRVDRESSRIVVSRRPVGQRTSPSFDSTKLAAGTGSTPSRGTNLRSSSMPKVAPLPGHPQPAAVSGAIGPLQPALRSRVEQSSLTLGDETGHDNTPNPRHSTGAGSDPDPVAALDRSPRIEAGQIHGHSDTVSPFERPMNSDAQLARVPSAQASGQAELAGGLDRQPAIKPPPSFAFEGEQMSDQQSPPYPPLTRGADVPRALDGARGRRSSDVHVLYGRLWSGGNDGMQISVPVFGESDDEDEDLEESELLNPEGALLDELAPQIELEASDGVDEDGTTARFPTLGGVELLDDSDGFADPEFEALEGEQDGEGEHGERRFAADPSPVTALGTGADDSAGSSERAVEGDQIATADEVEVELDELETVDEVEVELDEFETVDEVEVELDDVEELEELDVVEEEIDVLEELDEVELLEDDDARGGPQLEAMAPSHMSPELQAAFAALPNGLDHRQSPPGPAPNSELALAHDPERTSRLLRGDEMAIRATLQQLTEESLALGGDGLVREGWVSVAHLGRRLGLVAISPAAASRAEDPQRMQTILEASPAFEVQVFAHVALGPVSMVRVRPGVPPPPSPSR